MKIIRKKYRNLPVQIKASLWFLVCSFMQKGITTVTTPIFTRLLSTAEYGQYGVFSSWLSIASIFVTLNLSLGVYSQGVVKFEDERKVFSSALQGLTFVLCLAWTLVYTLFRDFWNRLFSLSTVQMYAMLSLIWTSAVFNFWASEQRVLYRYKSLVALTSLVSIAKPALGVFLVCQAEDKVTARILGWCIVELVCYSGLFFIQMWRGRQFFSARFWKYAVKFNIPLIPHYLSLTVLNSADRIMIKYMTGEADAGVYSLAHAVSLIMTLFNTALTQTVSPWVFQKIKANKIEDISPVGYISLVCVAGVNLLLIALAPEAVALFAPKAYYDAVYIIPPVAMSVYFMYSYDLFAKFAFYYEKTNFIMTASVVGALLNIVLNYIFIGLFGYKAAGYTTLVCYAVYSVGHYIFMNKVCDRFCNGIRPYDLKKLLRITILFVTAGFLLLLTYGHALIRYGILAAGLVLVIVKRGTLMSAAKNLLAIKK